jgi:hypothetical protein
MAIVQYDDNSSCNSCGVGENDLKVISVDAGCVSECITTCKTCGFTDYWAYGFFESSAYLEGKCKKYSFGEMNK